MNRRHIRVVAVVALVLVALTGARRSGGGGCDDDSGSSGGGTTTTTGGHYDDDDDFGSSGGSTSTSSGGRTSNSNALSDIRITDCEIDTAAKRLRAELSITNSSSESYDYMVSVKFTDPSHVSLGSDFLSSITVASGRTETATADSAYVDQSLENKQLTCEVTAASKLRTSS